jgi:pyruvate formate lyase activating enzyme
MKKGTICDIKCFSVHDGPGIRTTLFLKGCPLHCRWCHNPETLNPAPELGLFLDKCTGCGSCASVCHCHEIVNGQHLFHRNDCQACGKCIDACLFDALKLYGTRITVAEAMEIIMEDHDFYISSQGGVTISGGEPLLQPDFCTSLFQELKGHEIHTAIETCGHVPWHAFERILPWTDLFLYDFKHPDPVCHRQWTGQDNALIKNNLHKLSKTGKPIEIHLPLIPGCNTDCETLKAAGLFLGPLDHLIAVRLLPYHSMAHLKYVAVGHEDQLPDVSTFPPQFMSSCAAILQQYGLNVIY